MRWTVACLLSLFVIDMHAPRVDACGVKLTIKSTAPRKAVAHSSNPSEVLLLGNPPSRLRRDLAASGHHVDVASNAQEAAASKKSYAIVVTDASMQDQAKSSFASSIIMVRTNDVDNDLRSVEKLVARRPIGADTSRAVIAARTPRQPIAAGPPQTQQLVGAKDPKEPEAPAVAPPAPKPEPPKAPEPPPEEKITKQVTPPEETKPPEKAPAIAANTGLGECYFGLGAYKTGSTGALDKAAKKLKANPDVSVTIEGHADPTGTPEGNMELGQKRAEWARDYLEKVGIDAARIEVISYGDTRLKYGKSDGRNRRAAVVVK